jgi:hypothetical protein
LNATLREHGTDCEIDAFGSFQTYLIVLKSELSSRIPVGQKETLVS